MSQPPDASRARSAERRSWPVRLSRIDAGSCDDLSATTSPEERLAMMWPLAVEAYVLSGHQAPAYRRSEAPVALRPLRR